MLLLITRPLLKISEDTLLSRHWIILEDNHNHNMRSTNKQIASLMREVRQALGVRTNKDALNHVFKAKERMERYLMSRYDVSAVMLSPYRGGQWRLSCVDSIGCSKGQFRCPSMVVSPCDFLNTRRQTCIKFAEMFRFSPAPTYENE